MAGSFSAVSKRNLNCCQTHIFLQNFILIQPRTSPPKICKILQIYPILLTLELELRREPRTARACARRPGGRPSRAAWTPAAQRSGGSPPALGAGPPRRRRQRASVGKISARCCSFSAVSAPIFARKYAFCSIFQNLPDSQAEIFEI